jgi:hypothetical protein
MNSIEMCGIAFLLLFLAGCANISSDGRRATRHERLCDAGDMEACSIFGAHLFDGAGVGRDPQRALSLFQRSCEGGHLDGCYNLGVALVNGPETIRDLERARSVVEQGCEKGDAANCSLLGIAYRDGLGGPKDQPGALRSFESACEGGNGLGCANLGAAYHLGEGVVIDRDRAEELYRRSCELGESHGCRNIERLKADAPATTTAPGPPASSWRTTIGTTTVNGLVFDEVRSTCNMIETMVILALVRESAAHCARPEPSSRISLVTEDGTSSATSAPDRAVGECVAKSVKDAALGGHSCSLEFSVRTP